MAVVDKDADKSLAFSVRVSSLRIQSVVTLCFTMLLTAVTTSAFAQIIPSRESNITDLPRGQIERDRAVQAERERNYQSGSTLTGNQAGSSQFFQPSPAVGRINPAFIMPPRRPLAVLLPDVDIPVEPDDRAVPPRPDLK